MLPRPAPKNGKRIACVGAGPASLTVARDLAPLGYAVTVFDGDAKAGGFMRTQIPRFRLPEEVIDEEIGYILDLGVEFRGGERIDSMKALLARGLRRGLRRLRRAARARPRHPRPPGGDGQDPHRHRLAGVGVVRPRDGDRQARHRARRRQHRDGLLPLGAPPRRRRREGDRALAFEEMKASPWEKEDAMHEGIPILNLPRAARPSCTTNGKLIGMRFEIVKAVYDAKGRRSLVPTGEPDVDLRLRRGAGRGRPGERLPVDRARQRHRLRPVGPAGARRGRRFQSIAAARLLRRRRGARARRTSSPRWRTATRRRCRSTACCTARTSQRAPGAAREPDVAEDGHPRVELRQRARATTCATRCRGPRPRRRWQSIKVEVELGFDAADRVQGGRSAASTATCRRCSPTSCASSATPASTSARWTASASPPTATRPTCARG